MPPAALERLLREHPEERTAHLADLAAALTTAGWPLEWRVQEHLAAVARTRVERLTAAGEASGDEIRLLRDLMLVETSRLASDPELLARVLPIVERGMPPGAPDWLVEPLLVELNRTPGFDFFASELVERSWGLIRRRSATRRIELEAAGPVEAGPVEAPIELSIYALDSALFSVGEVAGFLGAVRELRPERALLLVTDPPMRRGLEGMPPVPATAPGRASGAGAGRRDRSGSTVSGPRAGGRGPGAVGGLHFADSWGRRYSPWPRDPVSFLRRPDGGLLALLRPDRQRTREEDSLMGLEVIQALPPELDQHFGEPTWAVSPLPFHNGNILPTDEAIWISLHTIEPHILERLGIERVPVESFAAAAGVDRYLAAARAAAAALGDLFGLPSRFVHPLPEAGDEVALETAMRRLGGGAGFDLDSVVSLLPAASAGPAALIADPVAGAELAAAAGDAELAALRSVYGLAPPAAELRAALVAAQSGGRAAGLGRFLDLVADHLSRSGFTVRRLPLLVVPVPLLRDAADYPDPDFLIGWNNVVTETAGGDRRAEGFSSALASGDALALDAFAALGYRLELLPPLAESIRRNGGYRCASNHVRSRYSEIR